MEWCARCPRCRRRLRIRCGDQLPHAARPAFVSAADLSRYPLRDRGARDDCQADRSGAAGRDPYRDRGHDRARGAALLPAARHSVHLELPYPACGLCRRAGADPGKLGVAMAAALSRPRRTRDGIDADADFRIVAARLPKSGAVAARRRRRPVRAARGGKARCCRGRSSSRSAAWRSKKISRRSCRSTCRAARWWSATGR